MTEHDRLIELLKENQEDNTYYISNYAAEKSRMFFLQAV